MSVLFGIEFIKPSESQAFKDLQKEFKAFKEKEENEDPIQEQKIRDIEWSLNKLEGTVETVSDVSMKNLQNLKRRINTVASSLARSYNNIDTVVVAVKGHTQKLEDIEKKLRKNNIKEAMKAAVTKQQLEEAMKAAATKQQQEIQAFKEEMQKEFELKSLQLQLKNAKINERGNQLLDARRKVLNPSGGKKKKKNNNRTT